MSERGVEEAEVRAVLESGELQEESTKGRLSREATFEFSGEWHGRRHPQKRVRVVCVWRKPGEA